MITVTGATVGPPARHALGVELRSLKAEDPLAPVSIIVPTNYVGVTTRRQLAAGVIGPVSPTGTGVAGISLLTVYRLADLLGSPSLARAGRRPVSTPVIAAAVREALARSPGLFGPATDHPATEEALVPLYRELRDLDPTQLERLATISSRARRVVDVHRIVAGILGHDWYDEFDLLDEARHRIRADPGAAQGQFGAFVVYLPTSLSSAQVQLVAELGRHLDVRCIVGLTGDQDADRSIHHLVRQLGSQLPQDNGPPPTADEIIAVVDADEEVRAVLRRVISDLVDGVAAETIAVLFPKPVPYARILHEQFTAAGITFNGEPLGSAARSLAGRTLLGLLELAENGLTPGTLAEWLAGSLIRQRVGQPRPVPIGAWQPVLDATRTSSDHDQWRLQLEQHRSSLELEAERLGVEFDDRGVGGHIRRELRHTAEVMDFLEELSGDLSLTKDLTSWTSMVDWAQRLLTRYLQSDDDSWPAAEAEALQAIDQCLDRLVALDRVEGSIGIHTFRRTVESELSQPQGRTGRLGHGVFIGLVGQTEGMDLERLYVLGMHEGSLPSPPQVDSVLGDRERAGLDGALPLQHGTIEDQHRRFLTSLAACSGRRVLLYPRGNLRRTSEHLPSRWLLESASWLHGASVNVDVLDQLAARPVAEPSPPWLVDVPSFMAGLQGCQRPATDTEDHLINLLHHSARGLDPGSHPLADSIPSLGRSLEAVASRHGDNFSRFDGNLGSVVEVDRLGLEVLDATRLEAWMACPHRYFLSYVLGVRTNRDPGGDLELPPTVRGFIVHQVLDRFCRAMLEDPDLATASDTDRWHLGATARQRLLDMATEIADDAAAAGLAGTPLLWERDRQRLMDDFLAFPDHDAARPWRGVVRGSELSFGTTSPNDNPVQRILPSGRAVQFRGSIDRLEQRSDGSLVVLDYKTGAPTSYADVGPDDPIAGGTRLQLPIYALAGRAVLGAPDATVHAGYWFVTSRPGGWEMKSVTIDDDVLGQFDMAIEHIVGSIEQGLFPHKPTPAHRQAWAGCPSCNPTGLHVDEFIERWQRKWEHGTLAALRSEEDAEGGGKGDGGPHHE